VEWKSTIDIDRLNNMTCRNLQRHDEHISVYFSDFESF
jgi:hypothetical protein